MTTKNEYEKTIAKSLPAIDEKIIEMISKNVTDFLDKETYKYLMLLCDELRYYTIFQVYNPFKSNKGKAKEIVDFLRFDDYLKTLGELKLIEVHEDYIEIWIDEYYFSLFICDSFMVQI